MINTSQFSTNINIKCPARLCFTQGVVRVALGSSEILGSQSQGAVGRSACWCFIIFSKCPPCDSQCECGLLFVFVFVMHFYIVQVPGLTVVLHRVVTSLTSGNCSHPLAVIKPLFTFMQMEFAAISVNCSHPDVLFPLFFANGALWLPSRWTLFFFMQMEFAYIFFTFTRRALFWLDTSRFLKFFKSGIKERRSSMRKKDRQIFRWAGALNANSNRCEKANARHIPDSNPYCGRLL